MCDSRFRAELSFAIKILEFRPPRISLDFVEEGLLFNFQGRKNRSKIAQIQYLKGVFRQIDYAESREHISFGREFWSEDSQF